MKIITGLPRKIDRLGRVVIPSELREILDFQENDDVEIFIEDGILKARKYVRETYSLLNLLDRLIRVIEEQTGTRLFIIDKYEIIVGKYNFGSAKKLYAMIENYRKEECLNKSEQNFRWRGVEYKVFRLGAQIRLFADRVTERSKAVLYCGVKMIRSMLDWLSLQK